MSKESRYWKGIILYMEEKQQDNQNQESERASDFEFLQEKIKERPIDKKNCYKGRSLQHHWHCCSGLWHV